MLLHDVERLHGECVGPSYLKQRLRTINPMYPTSRHGVASIQVLPEEGVAGTMLTAGLERSQCWCRH